MSTPSGDPTAALEAEITEFYKLYVQTINESWTAAEALQRRREMFADSCADCLRGYELARRAREEDMLLYGGIVSVKDVRIDHSTERSIAVTTRSSSSAGELRDQTGSIVQPFVESTDVQIVYQIEQDADGQWIIVDSQVSG